MKLIDTKCPKCGAILNIDSENKQASCEFCGASLLIDDEVNHIRYDNAEEAGYQFEKGRQRALRENDTLNNRQSETAQPNSTRPNVPQQSITQPVRPEEKNNKIWWIIGWIFMFPVPLMILLIRNKTLTKNARIAFIAAAWIVYIIVMIVANNEKAKEKSAAESQDSKVTEETRNQDLLCTYNDAVDDLDIMIV